MALVQHDSIGPIVGLITARGGSRGIPRKNVTDVAGKPLIAWTIEAALASRHLSEVIVSTDDEEIAATARTYGACVPFMRPAELARDDSPHFAVVEHAIDWLKTHRRVPVQFLLLLQPTSPLRTAQDIDAAVELGSLKQAPAVVSVMHTDHHPYTTYRLQADGTLDVFVPTTIDYLRRQALPPAYVLNGAIYLNDCEVLLRARTFVPQGTRAYVMPAERSLDIDSPWDLHLANLILRDRLGVAAQPRQCVDP
jgi:CMP-N,N'-diacetyllegionaminic acid synthase